MILGVEHDEPAEDFAVSTIRLWKQDGIVLMRVLSSGPTGEDCHSLATTDIDEALAAIRGFIVDFASPDSERTENN